ncbi:hypothetical protein [Sphingomonas hylomeconis]|uniref:Uncharacterized protein n=1 Tax=Sphingomonas hylomeconis TaxID=1395958 RepID=A0ABV7SS75_9SPHN|nr:hypothetical protein [Sphingomonas hylomeconis]
MIAAALALWLADQAAADTKAAPMKCEIGGIDRRFGSTEWIVYACDDGGSFVVVSKPGNPASPFYFIISRKPDGYGISGEGSGSKTASAAARDELAALGNEGLAALNAAARRQERDK